jgi:hypothetical protein
MMLKCIVVGLFVRRLTRTRDQDRPLNSIGDFIVLAAREPAIRDGSRGSKLLGLVRSSRFEWQSTLGRLEWASWVFWWISIVSVSLVGFFYWSVTEGSFSIAIPGGLLNWKYFPIILLIANSPQLWLSFGYVFWNNQLTRIWMEHEWRGFYQKRKLPRVSYDADRLCGVHATRFLQLPYAITSSLMALSITLHWLVFQALSVNGGVSAFVDATFILSPITLIIIGMIALTLVVGISIYGVVPIHISMPVMAGSAWVVFDACCQLQEPLPSGGIQWGDISTAEERMAGFGELVGKLEDGVPYPGLKGS